MQGMYSMRSPAVKRLMKEAQELREPTEQYEIHPLEDNLFEWHFTIRGPSETEFESGFYHGRIILPPEYPMKPPSIIILTPNGRFEVNKKICLSISGHHPESWQPSWSLRTALLAIIGFMPTHGAGALGSLDYTPDERKVLARRSQDFTCPTCGRIDNILKPVTEASEKTKQEAKELAAQIDFKDEKEKKAALQTSGPSEQGATEGASASGETPEATPDSAQQNSPLQQTFQFPSQPFGPTPFPFQMPFMQQGFPQMFPQQGTDNSSPNSQVPRFPLPFVGPMMPPPFFPPGMNPGNFPLPPMMPGMGMPPWQQNVTGDSASPSSAGGSGEQSQTSAGDSSQENIETIPSTTETTGVESTQNENTTQNQSESDSVTPQQTEPQTGISESVNISEGLRQRNVPGQSTSQTTSGQSSTSPVSTSQSSASATSSSTSSTASQQTVPQPSSQPESPAFIIFASIIIGLIFLLLFRRIWAMKYFSLIFQE